MSDLFTLEQADAAFEEGRLNEALIIYLSILDANAKELFAWYRSALILGRMGEKEAAISSLDLVAHCFAEAGQFYLALVAAKELWELNQDKAQRRMKTISTIYGAGSKRLGEKRRLNPPPLPERIAAVPLKLAQHSSTPQELREFALEVCQKTEQHWTQEVHTQAAKVPFHPLLSELNPEDLETVLIMMELKVVPAGTTIIQQGTEGNSFFILARGSLKVSRIEEQGSEPPLATLRPNAFLGEMALLTQSPRTAQVVSLTPSILFEVQRESIEKLADRVPEVASVLVSYTQMRLLRNLMATSAIFYKLDEHRREKLMGLFKPQVVEPGKTIIEEGQTSDHLYVVLSGAVSVIKKDNGEDLTLAELNSGQVFGEISLLQRRPATATVQAVEKTILLCLHRDAFNDHVEDYPEVLTTIYRLANEREQMNIHLQSQTFEDVDENSLLI